MHQILHEEVCAMKTNILFYMIKKFSSELPSSQGKMGNMFSYTFPRVFEINKNTMAKDIYTWSYKFFFDSSLKRPLDGYSTTQYCLAFFSA